MRVLRRIAGRMRFEHSEKDIDIRRYLKMPSIECILARARLRYIQRLVCRQPKVLVSLLASRVHGRALPWMELVFADMMALKSAVSYCSWLPDLPGGHLQWVDFMRSQAKWKQALACFEFVESSIGSTYKDPGPGVETALVAYHANHPCDKCVEVFTNRKALLAHQRRKHGNRVEQRFFANRAGICQVCRIVFHTHARLLRHLTDSRRTKCWSSIQRNKTSFN